jgi:hypothetical protein
VRSRPMTSRFASLRLVGLTLITALAVGCGRSHPAPGDSGAVSRLVEITVEPADQVLVIDGLEPATSRYTAIGRFEDGHLQDVSDRVAFSLADATLGTFLGPDFKSVLTHGGRTRVVAELAGVRGETGLVLRMRQRYADPNATGLPQDPAAPFTGPADAGRAPDVVYPNDGVLLPPNLSRLEVHFLPGASNSLFELAFENDLTDLKVYTRCVVPLNGGCIYTPDATVWSWLAETNRGGDEVVIRARATDDAGTGVGTSSELRLAFSVDNVKGGIYYWKASGGSAVMRFDFGNVAQTAAESFVGPSMAGGKCVGCHALSRDGTKLVASAGGWDVEDMLLVDVATATRTTTPPQAAFAAWNPSGTAYVGVFAYAGTPTHNLMLFDGTTGAQTGVIDVGATAAESTSHPDWSADGSRIVYVRAGQAYEQGVNNQRFYEGGIHMVSDQGGGAFGSPVTIVPAAPGKNRYYPSFSPDGELLAFNESSCPSGSTHIHCNADSDPTATVFVVKPEPGAVPVALARANAAGKTDVTSALTNSWPKWAPFEFQRTHDPSTRLVWMTFSSSRNYGLRTPPAGSGAEAPTGTLLWMVAIDPDRALAGQDPSYAAFCLPFQDLDSSNHIAQWTEDVIVLQ